MKHLAATVAVTGSVGTIVACALLTSLQVYVVAIAWSVSLLLLCGCYVFRVWQIYCCARQPATIAHRQEAEGDDDEDDEETAALNRNMASMVLPGKTIDATFYTTVVGACGVAAISATFMAILSDDKESNEVHVRSIGGSFVFVAMGALSSLGLLALLLEVWAAGWVSCGCCPRFISVPTYLLPQQLTVALVAAWSAIGVLVGIVCRMLLAKGISWCGMHVEFGAAAGAGVGAGVGVCLWLYSTFVFLPEFKLHCSPLQRDAYFGVVEAIAHKENVDGIGDDAL